MRATRFNEYYPVVSPDGRRIAYQSDESDRSEIYIQNYPGGGNRDTVSTGGGYAPRWSRNGEELFYFAEDAVMAVDISPDGSIVSAPRRLFDRSDYALGLYDVSSDGKQFLMIRRDPGSVPRQLNVILKWTEELQRQVLGEGK